MDAATGNNALHEMCRLFSLRNIEGWPFKFFRLLINRGVSVHARNRQGRTLLLQLAASIGALNSSAEGLGMFLRIGFDLNAQDHDGNGLLHLMVLRGAAVVLDDLRFCHVSLRRLDCLLVNGAGQTAANLVAARLAAHQITNHAATRLLRSLKWAQKTLWAKHTRPLLLKCLVTAMAVPDLAELALCFIDGSSRPSDLVDMQTDDDQPVASAAAARS